jgi:hypothetical protein
MKKPYQIKIIKEKASAILGKAGVLTQMEVERKSPGPRSRSGTRMPDAELWIRTPSQEQYRLLFAVAPIGQPRDIRRTATDLQNMIDKKANEYGVIVAPAISEQSALICQEMAVGFLDLCGNCEFFFDAIYIQIAGQQAPPKVQRPVRDLFATRTSRIPRMLLLFPKREWTVTELALESVVSTGQVSSVKQTLLQQEIIIEIEGTRGPRFRLATPKKLLDLWSKSYTYKKNPMQSFYAPLEVPELENRLSDACRVQGLRFALTLTSGAARVSPFLRYNRIFAYVENLSDTFIQQLGWKEVPSGANVTILSPYDEGVFYGLQEIDGSPVVSNLQLFLDLQSYPERGEEAAQAILENRLMQQW